MHVNYYLSVPGVQGIERNADEGLSGEEVCVECQRCNNSKCLTGEKICAKEDTEKARPRLINHLKARETQLTETVRELTAQLNSGEIQVANHMKELIRRLLYIRIAIFCSLFCVIFAGLYYLHP